jgi:signal transduction histidine kinase
MVWDAFIAVLVAAFQIRGTDFVSPGQDTVRALTDPGAIGYLLLAAGGLALVARRRWPVAVFAIVAAIDVAYYLAGYPDGPGWVGLFIALYTLTAQGDGRAGIRIAAIGIAALTAVWLLTADLAPLNGAGWVFFRIGAAVMAAALGESVRGRVAAASTASERAEHDREEQTRRRVDAERLRIAREVHDTVAHALSIINVQAGVTAHVLDRRPEQARAALLAVERTSATALQELRSTLGVLRDRPGSDEDLRDPVPGLDRVEQLAATAREAGLQVELHIGAGRPRLPSAVDHAAYRVVQEALTNAVRHAGPVRATVTIAAGPDDLEILVVDDGPGSDPGGEAGGSYGVIGMRERAELLGGTLEAGPGADGGFRVRARLPLRVGEVAHR